MNLLKEKTQRNNNYQTIKLRNKMKNHSMKDWDALMKSSCKGD